MSGYILRLAALVVLTVTAVTQFIESGFWSGLPWLLAAMYAAEASMWRLADDHRKRMAVLR